MDPWGVIDFLHHKIGSTHVAHHFDSTIPHYKAQAATDAITRAIVRHETSPKHLEKFAPYLNPKQAVPEDVTETSDYFRRREREEAIISGQKPARKKQPAQTSDYARRREQEKKAEKGVAEAGPFSHGAKKPRKGSVAHNAEVRRKEQEKNKQPNEPKDQMVGIAKVTKGVAEMDDRRHVRYHQVYGDPGENPRASEYRGPWYLDVEGTILQDKNSQPQQFWSYDDAYQYAVNLTNYLRQHGQPLKYAIAITRTPKANSAKI